MISETSQYNSDIWILTRLLISIFVASGYVLQNYLPPMHCGSVLQGSSLQTHVIDCHCACALPPWIHD